MSGTWSDNYARGERLGTWSTQLFQVEQRDTEGELIYKLGNGQWDIPALRKLLEDILPKNTFFKGFEVEHNFPSIIMIAMEDVSEIMTIVSRLAQYTNQLEETITSRTKKLEEKIVTLEKSIRKLGKK